MSDINITVDSKEVVDLKNLLGELGPAFGRAVAAIVRENKQLEQAAKATAEVQMEALNRVLKTQEQTTAQWARQQRQRLSMMQESERMAQRQAEAEAKLAQAQASQRAETAFALGKQRAEEEARAIEELNRAKLEAANREDFLKQKYDESYRAMVLYKSQVDELNEALSVGALSRGAYNERIEQLNQSLSDGTILMSNHTNQTRTGMNELGVAIQQTGYQVGDFLVQVQSGTNWMVAFGQQATQLVGILPMMTGFMGMSTGALVALSAGLGIAIPLVTAIGAAFMRTAGESETLTQSIQNLSSAVDEVSRVTENYTAEGIENLIERYGELDSVVLNLVENQRVYANLLASKELSDAMSSLQDAVGGRWFDIGISETASSMLRLREAFNLTANDARSLRAAFDEVAMAQTYDEQAVALDKVAGYLRIVLKAQEEVTDEQLEIYKAVIDSVDAVKILSETQPKQGWLSAAIEQAKTLGSTLWAAISAKAALSNESGEYTGGISSGRGGDPRDFGALPGTTNTFDVENFSIPGVTGSGGGSGGGTDPFEAQWEQMQNLFQTELEMETEQFNERQAILDEALGRRLISQQEHYTMAEQLATQHKEATLAIERSLQQERLAAYSGMFGDLAGLMSSRSKAMFNVGKAAAVAQAVVEGYSAAVTAWDKGMKIGGPPIAAAFAAASVARTGALIAGIKSTQFGGGATGSAGGGGAGSASVPRSSTPGTSTVAPIQQTPMTPQTVRIESIDPESLYSGQTLINLFDAFYNENDKRGKVFIVAR